MASEKEKMLNGQLYETAKSLPFVLDYGDRGIMLDNSAFSALVQFLYDECNWERFELELRIKHFEGWEEIDWSKWQFWALSFVPL